MKIKPQKLSRMFETPSMDEPRYPQFSMSLKDFPEAKDWEVGEEYHIEMTVRQSDKNQTKGGRGSVSFEILDIDGDTLDEESSENEAPEEEEKTYPRKNK